jgi:D-alanyl-D-alanine carboxypeptidase
VPPNEIKLAKILMDKPPPHTTAYNWAIYDQEKCVLLFGKNERERREVASLTKIMVAYTVLKLSQRLGLDIEKELVTVSYEASATTGTSADLVEGDTLTILQLLYGLMLPSGNDAGVALAEYFGAILAQEKEQRK